MALPAMEEDQVKEWIWEYILKHCQGYEVLACLLHSFQPPNVPKLKKLINLKLLSGLSSERLISTTSLDCLSSLELIIKEEEKGKQDAEYVRKIRNLYLVLKREIAVQFLRDENYNLERFEEIMHNYWEQDTNSNDPETQAVIHELWSVVSKPDLRIHVIGKYKRENTEKMIKDFVSSAWVEFGQPFLEKLVHDIFTGVYKPDSCYKLEKNDMKPGNASPGEGVEISSTPIQGTSKDLANEENNKDDMEGVAKKADFVSPPPWADSEEDGSLGTGKRRKLTRRRVDHGALDAQNLSDSADEILTLSERRKLQRRSMDYKALDARKSLKVSMSELKAQVTDPLPAALALAKQLKQPTKAVDATVGERAAEQATVVNIHLEEGIINMNSKEADKLAQTSTPDETRTEEAHVCRVAECAENAEAHMPVDGKNLDNATGPSGEDIMKSKQLNDSVSRPKTRFMDRNPTAQTLEWEEIDSTDQSSREDSPSSSKRVRLPTSVSSKQVSPLKTGNRASHRRKFCKWTEKEEEVLRNEVNRYGKGRWKLILQRNFSVFQNRSEVDLKDKWRNIERAEGISGFK